jgi:hypothetical protein
MKNVLLVSVLLATASVTPAYSQSFTQQTQFNSIREVSGQFTGSSLNQQVFNQNLLQPVTGNCSGDNCGGVGNGYLQTINNENVLQQENYNVLFRQQDQSGSVANFGAAANCNCALFSPNGGLNGANVNGGSFGGVTLPTLPTFNPSRVQTTFIR